MQFSLLRVRLICPGRNEVAVRACCVDDDGWRFIGLSRPHLGGYWHFISGSIGLLATPWFNGHTFDSRCCFGAHVEIVAMQAFDSLRE